MTRSCGSCSECCSALGVHELNKEMFVPCRYQIQSEQGGCGVYDKRPTSCREFSCVWLDGNFEEQHRPDRIGFVLATADLYEDLVILIAYPSRPDALQTEESKTLLNLVAQQIPICIFHPNGRRQMLIAEDQRHLLPRIQLGLEARAVVDENGELRRLPLVPEADR